MGTETTTWAGQTTRTEQATDAEPTEGKIGIQLLTGPASRRSDPRAHIYVVDHLPPGDVIRREVLVVNKTTERKRIEVYPAAATIEKERFQFGAGRATNELTTWISVNHDRFELGPGDEKRIKMTIAVPPKASAGERYAVLWASVASDPKPSANVNRVNRVGVRIYLDVGSGGEPASSFTIGEAVPARDRQGRPSLNISVRNTGGRALDLMGSVELTDGPAGTRAGPFEVVRGTSLAPGGSGSVLVTFPADLPNGPWQMRIDLHSGTIRQQATGRITFPGPGQSAEPRPVSAGVDARWWVTGSLAVGTALLLGLAVVSRRSHRLSRR